MNLNTRAILTVGATIVFALIGISVYSSGNSYMTLFGIKLSLNGFILLLGAFVIYDIIAITNAFKAEKHFSEIATVTQERLAETEPLEAPCKVSITRLSSVVGSAYGVRVLLNGTEMGVLKSGKTLEFTTEVSDNELTVRYIADNTTNSIAFTAESGGSVQITLKFRGAVLTVVEPTAAPITAVA